MDDMELAKCAQLDMLFELKRICEKYDIHYFLTYGTLLGAVRHDGFIPWDDDVDVQMLRPDYERFKEVCAKDLDIDYELLDWHKDEKSPLPFLKMKIKGTHYKEELAKDLNKNDAIFIDIFPIDNLPDNNLARRIQWRKAYFIKKILLLRCGYAISRNKNIIKKLLYWLLATLSRVRSVYSWKLRYEKLIQKYNKYDTKGKVCFGGPYSLKREARTKEMVCEYIQHQFEIGNFTIPTHYDEILSRLYGNYMKFPPKEQQVSRHGISYIDLGNYKIKSKILNCNKIS
jgi:lipopolysaccharide cholinephosphotransferase